MCKVFSFYVVVGLDEDLSENGFSDRVVFGVELVKPMERITILISEWNQASYYDGVFFCTQTLSLRYY